MSHQYCCCIAAVTVVSRWGLSSPNNKPWVCSHASGCWLKKKRKKSPLMHKHESMESPQQNWPLKYGSFSCQREWKFCLAIFKIQGKSSHCAKLTALTLNLPPAEIRHRIWTVDFNIDQALCFWVCVCEREGVWVIASERDRSLWKWGYFRGSLGNPPPHCRVDHSELWHADPTYFITSSLTWK